MSRPEPDPEDCADDRADDRADDVFIACRRRIDAGEAVDVEQVVLDHPELAGALRERFAALDRLGRAFSHGPPGPPSLAGRLIGPYRLERVLGAGGMGTVYAASVEGRAPQLAPGVRVAVKVIHPHLFARDGYFKRFLREAEIGRRLRHANVVRTLDADAVVDGGAHVHFVVMEYVEGQTLRSLADEMMRVPEELCRRIGAAVARALAEVHGAGAIHRDVKPDNVLITRDHVVKLMDLGVARLADDEARLSQTGAFVGSVLYAAPEQFRPREGAVDARADLYSLGLVLYELATGRHPFADDDVRVAMQRQLTERARPAAEMNPQLSPLFEDLVARLLEKDRDARPASATLVAEILEQGEESDWWKDRARAIRVETRRPLRRIRIPRETALYGRDAELAKLRAAFERAKSGDGQVVLVEGEAGIGKSRLVDEFVGLLCSFVVPPSGGTGRPGSDPPLVPAERGTTNTAEDINYLFGSYPPGGAATASGAFSTAYREHFGDDEAAIRQALPVTPLLVPAFAALLRGDAAPTDAEPLTKDSLQTVFVHATRSFAAERPTIVLIDDLHFAPEEGRALFMSLALAVPGHRILLVGTARPGVDEKWLSTLDRVGAARLPLPRLGPKDLVRLLADSLKSEHLAEELSGRIAVKSDGNPFFVFEILRGLREGQFLTKRPDGTWVTTQILCDIQIPSSIADLVSARVADLDEADRDLLDVAACVGFEFDPSLVAAALGAPVLPTLKRFGQIERKHRLVRSAGRRMVFDHHQVQEALYGGLMEQVREHYHGSIADAIERGHSATAHGPEDLDGALCVDLAEHFLKGGHGARALRYLDAALTHLEKGYLNDAAVRLAERALAVPGLLAGSERGKTLLRLAGRFDLLGRRDRQRAAIEEALALARETGDRPGEASATSALGEVYRCLGRHAESREHHERHLTLAREIGDRRAEGLATGSLGSILRSLGRYVESRQHHERQLVLARECGDRRDEGRAMGCLGGVLRAQGRYAEAREHLERHLALAREIGDRRGEAAATGNLGVVLWSMGLHAEARESYQRHLTLAREIGDRRAEAHATVNLGSICWSFGRLAEARENYRRGLALTRDVGDRWMEAAAAGNLGSVLRALGRHDESREFSERHLALAREIGDRQSEASALDFLGDAAAEAGDASVAMQCLADALHLFRAIGARDGEPDALRKRGALAARLGRMTEARADFGEALSIARELSIPGLELVVAAWLANLSGGDVAAALAALAALEGRSEERDAMEARFLLWQATRDRTHLVEAKRRLDFMIEHAPPEDRESMRTNVRVHREILEAATAAGL